MNYNNSGNKNMWNNQSQQRSTNETHEKGKERSSTNSNKGAYEHTSLYQNYIAILSQKIK